MFPALERGLAAPLTGLVLAACLLPTQAAALGSPFLLAGEVKNMNARLDDASGLLAQDQQIPLARVSQGGSFAEADYSHGTFKGDAVAAPVGISFMLATAAFDVMATNTSGVTIPLPSSTIGLDLHASFSRSLGIAPAGAVGNTINAVFSIAILAPDQSKRYSGYGFYQYRYTLDIDDPIPELIPLVEEAGGFTVTKSEDADEAHAKIVAPALDLLPGETLGLVISVSASANVINLFGGTGFAARTDFGNTAQLYMRLPAGVEFVSSTPAYWVTAVPEPASWALWLAGLAGVALRRFQRA